MGEHPDPAHWLACRRLVRDRSRCVCEFCWRSPLEDLHHRLYDRFGRERAGDLMGACRPCHDAIHDGGEVLAYPGSPAARGDRGRGFTAQWFDYLAEPDEARDARVLDVRRALGSPLARDQLARQVAAAVRHDEAYAAEKARHPGEDWSGPDAAWVGAGYYRRRLAELDAACAGLVRVTLVGWRRPGFRQACYDAGPAPPA